MKTSLLSAAVLVSVLAAATARDIHVNPAQGDDHGDGGTAPLKTIARAATLAKPGDTIHLDPDPALAPYRDAIVLKDKAGEPGVPITVDGHGAVLVGTDPLQDTDWESAGDGLFKSTKFAQDRRLTPPLLMRFFFVFDGTVQTMNRSSKGSRAEFKKPADLQPGEWTYDQAGNAFYVKLAPGKTLSQAKVEAPVRSSGATVTGTKSAHLVIRNVTVRHFWNDGFNIHGVARDIRFENIAAVECGDDGFSAHDDTQVEVQGFTSKGNSTGICNVGNSVCRAENITFAGNVAYEFYIRDGSQMELTNARIVAGADKPFSIISTAKGAQPARLKVSNVLVVNETNAARVLDLSGGGVLEADRLTTLGLTWRVKGSVDLSHSVVAGGVAGKVSVELGEGSAWKGGGNLYDVTAFGVRGTRYTADKFVELRAATGTDANSEWTTLAAAAASKYGAPENNTTPRGASGRPGAEKLPPDKN